MHYVDTSFVALQLLGQEGGAQAERIMADVLAVGAAISSVLLEIELTRVARRTGAPLTSVRSLLDEIHLVDINRDVVDRACALTDSLKSLDAIHLATALILDSDRAPITLLTHDAHLAAAARRSGLRVAGPDSSDGD